MDINFLAERYRDSLEEFFEKDFRIEIADDSAYIFLDGDKEEFMFSLYGDREVRLYWCDECFIYSTYRNNLTSSDTHGEIVYEGKLTPEALPPKITELIMVLKNCVFLEKHETVIGRTFSGYDIKKKYIITARGNQNRQNSHKFENIEIRVL